MRRVLHEVHTLRPLQEEHLGQQLQPDGRAEQPGPAQHLLYRQPIGGGRFSDSDDSGDGDMVDFEA